IVFMDVESINSTALEFYDMDGTLVHTEYARADTVNNGTFSFVGVAFTTERIARVQVTPGGAGGFCSGGSLDCVAMDDFIYGEPVSLTPGGTTTGTTTGQPPEVPEPSTYAMAVLGLVGVALRRGRA
ncbi:MAG: PEP-CTERM sorting domain-containing protein, partial [Bryobacterales bacterium]|nr:PEP-CTERM sorting domain-containing protein [Bryobacterales bacterium]